MPSRRRTTTPTRRPRVAGLTPDGARTDTDGGTVTEPRPPRVEEARVRGSRPAPVEPVLDDEPAAPAAPAPDVDADGTPEPGGTTRPIGRSGRGRLLPTAPATTRDVPATGDPATGDPAGGSSGLLGRLRTVPVLAGALAVLLVLAVFFGVSTLALRSSPAAANTALTDVGTTSEVANQLGDALETVYSYDFARLDENERAAREVITTEFSTEFDRLFAQVRELAPQQQAVVSATVAVSAVQQIDGDRAVLVAFMNQQATTVANAEQAAAAGRLTVTGERVDGRWKIAGVESR